MAAKKQEHTVEDTAAMMLEENRRLRAVIQRIQRAAADGQQDCLGDSVAEGSFMRIHGLASRALGE